MYRSSPKVEFMNNFLQCRRQSIQVGGGGGLILALLQKHAEHNAITSAKNVNYINWRYKFINAFFGTFL